MVMFNNKSLPQMVKNNKVNFVFYKEENLWYEINVDNQILQFPVPTSDTGNGIFLASDKATLFMRYIKKHLENLDALIQEEKLNEENYK